MNTQFKILATTLIAASLSFSSAYAASQKLAPTPSSTIKPALGLKSAGGGAVKDDYCSPKGTAPTVHVPWNCGPQFKADCKRLGGTLSGTQPWGGKTCHSPS